MRPRLPNFPVNYLTYGTVNYTFVRKEYTNAMWSLAGVYTWCRHFLPCQLEICYFTCSPSMSYHAHLLIGKRKPSQNAKQDHHSEAFIADLGIVDDGRKQWSYSLTSLSSSQSPVYILTMHGHNRLVKGLCCMVLCAILYPIPISRTCLVS